MCSPMNLDECLKAIAEEEGIIDPKICIDKGSERGDNYMGEMKTVDINGRNKNLHLIVKKAPKSVELRKQVDIAEVYANEILFYQELFPQFDRLQKERNVKEPFKGVAKCYKTVDTEYEEALIFENLCKSGYSMWNRKVTMNKAHVICAFKNYAKFHAMSYAMKQVHPETYNACTSKMKDIFGEFMENPTKMQGFTMITDKLKIKVDETLHDENINRLFCKLCDNWLEFFTDLRTNGAGPFSVVLHGDCWCNNMLFKYENSSDHSVPIDMKIIDWQIIKMGLPVLDMSHFLYICTSKEIYDDLDNLLQIYHTTLVEHATNLGADPETLITFDQLKAFWKSYGKYGLVMSFITLKIMLSDSEEAPDMSESTENGNDVLSAFDFQTKHEHEYQRRLNDIILHLYNNDFL